MRILLLLLQLLFLAAIEAAKIPCPCDGLPEIAFKIDEHVTLHMKNGRDLYIRLGQKGSSMHLEFKEADYLLSIDTADHSIQAIALEMSRNAEMHCLASMLAANYCSNLGKTVKQILNLSYGLN